MIHRLHSMPLRQNGNFNGRGVCGGIWCEWSKLLRENRGRHSVSILSPRDKLIQLSGWNEKSIFVFTPTFIEPKKFLVNEKFSESWYKSFFLEFVRKAFLIFVSKIYFDSFPFHLLIL